MNLHLGLQLGNKQQKHLRIFNKSEKTNTKNQKKGVDSKNESKKTKGYNPNSTCNNNNSAFNISRSNNKYGATEMRE